MDTEPCTYGYFNPYTNTFTYIDADDNTNDHPNIAEPILLGGEWLTTGAIQQLQPYTPDAQTGKRRRHTRRGSRCRSSHPG